MIAGVVMPVSARVALESPVSSEMNEEDESPEADLDYLDEYDSEEARRQRKKRKVQLLLMIVCHFIVYCLCVVFSLQPRAGLWLQLSSPRSEFPPEIMRKTNPLPANVSLGNVIARVW